jgi:hypothetical protein
MKKTVTPFSTVRQVSYPKVAGHVRRQTLDVQRTLGSSNGEGR